MTVQDVLALENTGPEEFRGPAVPTKFQRTFGGQVVSQALAAAQRTVTGLVTNSLHGYFISGGDATLPIEFSVEHIRDGKSFATRQVRAFQKNEAIFILTVSFHRVDDDGPSHQDPMPDVPLPHTLPERVSGTLQSSRLLQDEWKDWDVRPVPEAGRDPEELSKFQRSGYRHIWFRNTAELPEELCFHQAALTYMSDMTLLYSSLIPHPGIKVQMASLDHAVWFHRPLDVGEWMLYVQHSPSAGNGVALTRGTIFDINGRLIATVMQEGLTRTFKDSHERAS